MMNLENDIIAINEKHEIDMKTAKEDYEKKLVNEDIKYARLEQYIRDVDEDMKKLHRLRFTILRYITILR